MILHKILIKKTSCHQILSVDYLFLINEMEHKHFKPLMQTYILIHFYVAVDEWI